jgi:starvation-inducible DNA-binding protein
MNNLIGLNKEKAEELSQKLNGLLANYQMFYQNLRGFHWNIRGREFFELHVKFEEFYDNAVIKVDEIAERILTLEGTPIHTFGAYISMADIPAAENKFNGKECVEIVIQNFSVLINTEREILTMAGEANDEGTVSLMSDYITETEKTMWMLNAYLR